MKLSVEYRCGHILNEVRFGGNYDEQLERAREYLDCPDCYKQRMIEERQAESAAVQETIQDLPLAALQGSEKQVKWANDLRAKVISEVRKMPPKTPEQAEKFARLLDVLAKQPSAKWWIDHRDESWMHLAANVAKAEGII